MYVHIQQVNPKTSYMQGSDGETASVGGVGGHVWLYGMRLGHLYGMHMIL